MATLTTTKQMQSLMRKACRVICNNPQFSFSIDVTTFCTDVSFNITLLTNPIALCNGTETIYKRVDLYAFIDYDDNEKALNDYFELISRYGVKIK